MHLQAHQLFVILAVNLVVASPFFAYWLDRRGFFGDREPMVTVARGLVIPLAVLSIGGAAIHLAMLPTHVADSPVLGLVYGAGALFSVLWAVAWLRRPTRSVALTGIALTGALIALWITARVGGSPFAAEPGAHARMGLSETVAAMLEVTLVLGLAARLWRPLARVAESRSLPAQSASLGVAMALVAISMVTVFGMASA